jgi:CTP:molybdopterin cytidylyltransferase MocA
MFGSMLAAGQGGNRGGPQLLARWYERNIIMAHNLTRVLRPGTRRVLVVVGSGHVPPMRNVLHESPDFCPVSPLPYLR